MSTVEERFFCALARELARIRIVLEQINRRLEAAEPEPPVEGEVLDKEE